MSGASVLGRLRVGRRPSTADRRPHTARELLTTVDRLALWLALAVVFLRGLAGVFATERTAPAPRVSRDAAAATWPDDAARAIAVEFASAYLTHSPTEDPGAYTTALEAFASPELVAQLAPRFDAQEPREVVQWAAVARADRVDDARALVTVAAPSQARP